MSSIPAQGERSDNSKTVESHFSSSSSVQHQRSPRDVTDGHNNNNNNNKEQEEEDEPHGSSEMPSFQSMTIHESSESSSHGLNGVAGKAKDL
jgi:hypothetical protein